MMVRIPVFRRLINALRPKPEPLTGAPRVSRQKTYSAGSGYGYQYHSEGSRGFAGGREYVFLATSGRGEPFPVSVKLHETVVRVWEQSHGRELSRQERFALAKLSMKQAFDERESPDQMRAAVEPTAAEVDEILTMLGVD
jgi:hypothetical protein